MVAVLPDTLQPAGIYKPGEVCEILDIGSSTLWRYVKAGYIKAVHRPTGKMNLFRGQDVINLHKYVY